MNRFTFYIYLFLKLLTCLLISAAISAAFTIDTFTPYNGINAENKHEPLDESLRDDASEPLLSAEKNLGGETETLINPGFDFYVYDHPSFRAEKIDFLQSEYVRLLKKAAGGWIFAATSKGDYWLNCERNCIYVTHYTTAYDNPESGEKSELLPPQLFTILDSREDGWFLIKTKDSEKWIDIEKIPEKLSFEANLYDQTAVHPNGCESYAATSVLNIFGSDITPSEFISFVPQNITKRRFEKGKMIWGDPDKEFVGSMTSLGYSAYPPVIEKVINDNFYKTAAAKTITGASFEEIITELASGACVLIWFHPSGRTVSSPESWYTSEGKYIEADFGTHTVALTGYDLTKETVIYCDSIGAVVREVYWSDIEPTFDFTGRKALSISSVYR